MARVSEEQGGDSHSINFVVHPPLPGRVQDRKRARYKLTQIGGLYEKAADWASFVVTDGKLVTGQNPASSKAGAEALLKLLA
jgi:putative intracellular protease/amidase